MRTSFRPLTVTLSSLALLLPCLEACFLGTSSTGSGTDSTADGGTHPPCQADDAGGCTATGPTYPCSTGSECLGLKDTACTTAATCMSGVCAFTYAPKGMIYPSQIAGDCRQKQCDGQGNVEDAPLTSDVPPQVAGDCRMKICSASGNVDQTAEDTDLPPATNDCAVPKCSSGTLSENPKPEATLCSSSGGRTCDGRGVCRYCAKPNATCDEPGPATANNTQATAYDFGNIGDDDSNGKELCGIFKGNTVADTDWYKYGGYTQYVFGVSVYKNDPSLSVYTPTDHVHMCIYTSCGAADFICPAGTTLDIAPLGQRGCCQDIASGAPGMDIPSSCSGPEVWMSVKTTDATTCTGYDLKCHF